jgi:hypothetical protein
MAPHWDGLRWVNDPLLISGSPLTMLAPPNYSAFMAVASLAGVAVVRRAKAVHQRGLLLTAVFTWCTLEIIGWFLTAAALVPSHNAAWDLGALMTLVFSTVFLSFITRLALRATRARDDYVELT